MKVLKSKKIFFIMSFLLVISLIASYYNTKGSNVTNIKGNNIGLNVLNFEINKLKMEFENYSKEYNYFFSQKFSLIKDIEKENINIGESKIKEKIKFNYEKIFEQNFNLNNYQKNINNVLFLSLKEFEYSSKSDLLFDLHLNGVSLINKDYNNYKKDISKQLSKKITILVNSEEKILSYNSNQENNQLFFEVLINSYLNIKNHKISINNEYFYYEIKKIEEDNSFTIDEKLFDDINNKSIINYYF